jgi:hypothetical protein
MVAFVSTEKPREALGELPQSDSDGRAVNTVLSHLPLSLYHRTVPWFAAQLRHSFAPAVDRHQREHGTPNLYVASSATFVHLRSQQLNFDDRRLVAAVGRPPHRSSARLSLATNFRRLARDS